MGTCLRICIVALIQYLTFSSKTHGDQKPFENYCSQSTITTHAYRYTQLYLHFEIICVRIDCMWFSLLSSKIS